MNCSTSTRSIPSQETSSSPSGRLESIILGLLLIGTCLSAMSPQPTFRAKTPKPALGGETVAHLMETRSFPHGVSNDQRPSATRIRRMPTSIVTADAIAEVTPPTPTILAVETIPAVEIVPLETLPSTSPVRP